ncbi:MAG TPA: protein kinase [Woeseiaceae bacterium]|nr:protein kinase [Woeseiaceae bacterium]
MNASLENIEESFSNHLDEFDQKIKSQVDNAELLEEIHKAITVMFSKSRVDESNLRELLQKRYNAGKMRLETYQLVRNVLDRVAIESMATMPEAIDHDDTGDSFSETIVIAPGSVDNGSPQDRLQVGTVLRDRFLLHERVAGGSMGVVFKALDRRLAEAEGFEPWVAVKVLSSKLARNGSALRALQQEAAKGRCLSHPNIVRFIDLDRDEDMYFIVMEWLEGRSLAAILDENRNKKIDQVTALDIVRQVANALDYAHRCGVIHADVKPANIMITPSGQVKLFDFGVARIRQQQHQLKKDFDPGVLGAITPAYSSMQVLTGEDPTPADDVFSLGCLMYRMVAGHRVFGPRNAAEAAEQGMEPQRPLDITDTQWRALKKSLAYARVARFATPAEFVQALDSDGGHVDSNARVTADRIFVEPKPPVERRRRGIGIGAAVVVALGVAAVLISQPELVGRLQMSAGTFLQEIRTTGGPASPAAEPDPAASDRPAPDDAPQTVEPAEPLVDPGLPADQPVETLSGEEAPGISALPAAEEMPVDAPAEEAETVDFSTLPPPTDVINLARPGSAVETFDLQLREDSEEAFIDLVREFDVGEPLTVQLDEVGFNGNQSPWGEGRYRLGNDGKARFAAGQERARITLSMPTNTLRESDRQATLLVHNIQDPSMALATINLTLEDDDQRNFETDLPRNTAGFSAGRVLVRESDPAVQIDVLRFNPDDNEFEVRYTVRDGTAIEGEDYFLPGATALVFGPGQRSARLLIPLVQDSVVEADETFTLEIVGQALSESDNIWRQVTVTIRDDD